LSNIYSKVYFNLDLSVYFTRPFKKERGDAYIYFGEGFSVRKFLEEQGDGKRDKWILADKIGEEILKLENLYKDKKL